MISPSCRTSSISPITAGHSVVPDSSDPGRLRLNSAVRLSHSFKRSSLMRFPRIAKRKLERENWCQECAIPFRLTQSRSVRSCGSEGVLR